MRYLSLYVVVRLITHLDRTGTHRYTFLLFREPAGGVNFTLDDFGGGHAGTQRRRWNAFKFAEQKGMKLVGANFFLVHT
jgi:hypothetical protein